MSLSRNRIEAEVLAAYDAVKSGVKFEDGLVELKADWPDPVKAARRLAGHLNAARGEDVLWVIGLDELQGVSSFSSEELANWWPQVCRCFESTHPRLVDVLVSTPDGALLALHFDGSGGPHVVRNPRYGQQGAGPVEREVPWREGTRVRSATREDLIRLLVPLQELPDVDVLSASAFFDRLGPGQSMYGERTDGVYGEGHLAWSLSIELYITPAAGSLVVFPTHATALAISMGSNPGEWLRADMISYASPTRLGANQVVPDSASVETTSSEAIIHLPGRVNIRSGFAEAMREVDGTLPLRVRFSVTPVHTSRPVQLEIDLPPGSAVRSGKPTWRFDKPDPEIEGW